jgi:hypothetical protein
MKKIEQIHRKFLVKETLVGIMVNAVISGIIAFFMFRSQSEIPLWGKNGLFFDLIPTIFLMTFCMTLGMTPATRARIGKGKAPVAPWHRSEYAVFRVFPRAFVLRAFVFGAMALLILLPTTTVLVSLLNGCPMTFTEMLLFKICYGALIGLLLTPAITLVAMADEGGADFERVKGEV